MTQKTTVLMAAALLGLALYAVPLSAQDRNGYFNVRSATTTLLRGTQVGEIFEGQKIFRVMVWGEESVRRDIDTVRRMMIPLPVIPR